MTAIVPARRTAEAETNGHPLHPYATELFEQSSIAPDVAAERGYRVLHRPPSKDSDPGDVRGQLTRAKIPKWAWAGDRESGAFPMLVIPTYSPSGQRVGMVVKPRTPATGRDGKQRKYVQPGGQAAALDVHPRSVPAMTDPTVELWITEGTKKGDSLVTRGKAAIAVAGVYGWRGGGAVHPAWEEVLLKGRVRVVVCFDSDVRTNRRVRQAAARLAKWLLSRGVKDVRVVAPLPDESNGVTLKQGVDDYLGLGGRLDDLPDVDLNPAGITANHDGRFTDALMAEEMAVNCLDGFRWNPGLGWLAWDGRRWAETDDTRPMEACRQYAEQLFREALDRWKSKPEDDAVIALAKNTRRLLDAGPLAAALKLARGIDGVHIDTNQLDAHPELLNTPGGVVDLRTGEVSPHDPDLLLTKITRGSYRPDLPLHPDWQAALTALPPAVADWMQMRFGQAVTGRPTPDDRLCILRGGGSNGKSLMVGDGLLPAVGDYGWLASPKLLQLRPDEHSTELADLRGRRFVLSEETAEGKAIDIPSLKRLMGTSSITARKLYRDNVTFDASHSLFLTSNYQPILSENDHGTTRRLVMVEFPYTFRKPGEPLTGPRDRTGDPGLRQRLRDGAHGQHDAIVTWLVQGAVAYHLDQDEYGSAAFTTLPGPVEAATKEWFAGADRVLAFVDDWLEFDTAACVDQREVYESFSEGLQRAGHRAWSLDTFVGRFVGNDELRQRGVEKRRTRDLSGLSLKPRAYLVVAAAAPAQRQVLTGLRWQPGVLPP